LFWIEVAALSTTLPLSQSIRQLEKFVAIPLNVTVSPTVYVALFRVKLLIAGVGRSTVYVPEAVTQSIAPDVVRALMWNTKLASVGSGDENVNVIVAEVPSALAVTVLLVTKAEL
jgi:hypothetical protein